MLTTGDHPVACETYLLPGCRAQHSARVRFNAYRPLHRPADTVLNQHDPRTSLAVTSATAAVVGSVRSVTTVSSIEIYLNLDDRILYYSDVFCLHCSSTSILRYYTVTVRVWNALLLLLGICALEALRA